MIDIRKTHNARKNDVIIVPETAKSVVRAFVSFFPFRIWNSWPPSQQRTSRRRCVSRVIQPKRACTSTPINGFRLLTDVRSHLVQLLHATFHDDQRCSSSATNVNGRNNANPFFRFFCATCASFTIFRIQSFAIAAGVYSNSSPGFAYKGHDREISENARYRTR